MTVYFRHDDLNSDEHIKMKLKEVSSRVGLKISTVSTILYYGETMGSRLVYIRGSVGGRKS